MTTPPDDLADIAPPYPGLGDRPFPNGYMGAWDAADVGQIIDIGQVTALGSVSLGDSVRKHGIATNLTHGVVDGVLGTYPIANKSAAKGWWMMGQIYIKPAEHRPDAPDHVNRMRRAGPVVVPGPRV